MVRGRGLESLFMGDGDGLFMGWQQRDRSALCSRSRWGRQGRLPYRDPHRTAKRKSRIWRASSTRWVPVERRTRCLVWSRWWTVKWHHHRPWLRQRWWSRLEDWTRMDVCMALMSIATRPEGFWNDEGRRSDDETTALVQEWLLLIRTFARTSETVAGLQSTAPTTQGRLLSCGFLPAGPQDASRSDRSRKPCPRIRGNRPVCHSPVAIGGVHPRELREAVVDPSPAL